MRARKVPGALALGLLASLIAHTAAYGGSHDIGGAYHGFLVSAAAIAVIGSLLLAASLAWAGAGRTLEGSVLASRLRLGLPTLPYVAGSAVLWFTLGERIEASHAPASPALLLIALVFAAWLVSALTRSTLSILAAIAIAMHTASFTPRAPVWSRCVAPVEPTRRLLPVSRRFARPPPYTVTGA